MDATRQEFERREETALALFALRSAGAPRPRPLDPEGRVFDYRTEYQRDRDRILHARAFRRLRLKAEGGAAGPGERRRDRLTHTLEVVQIARTIARALTLNEDLAEAIALGHALGSPPFGRDGAQALDEALARIGPRGARGFHVHLQSLRVVDLIEKRYDHPGLNLTNDVREGLLKQRRIRENARAGTSPSATDDAAGAGTGSQLAAIDLGALDIRRPASLEAQAVRAADRIASTLGDLDDALRAGEIDPADVEGFPIVRELLRRVGERYPARARRKVSMKANVIHRGLTHLLVTATIHQSRRTLRIWCRTAGIDSHDAFLAARGSLPPRALEMSPRSLRLFETLRETLGARLHATAATAHALARAGRVIGDLFEAYHRDPRLLDDYVLLRFKEAAGGGYLRDLAAEALETEVARRYHGSGVLVRLIADHIAGMTDVYAHSEHDRLFDSTPRAGGSRLLP